MNTTQCNPEIYIHRVQGFDNDNSTGICLPKNFTKTLKIIKGNFLRIYLDGRHIMMEKV